jgi:hypothetical protein
MEEVMATGSLEPMDEDMRLAFFLWPNIPRNSASKAKPVIESEDIAVVCKRLGIFLRNRRRSRAGRNSLSLEKKRKLSRELAERNHEQCQSRRRQWFDANAGDNHCAWFFPLKKQKNAMPVRFVKKDDGEILKEGWYGNKWVSNERTNGGLYSVPLHRFEDKWFLMLTKDKDTILPIIKRLQSEGRVVLIRNLTQSILEDI